MSRKEIWVWKLLEVSKLDTIKGLEKIGQPKNHKNLDVIRNLSDQRGWWMEVTCVIVIQQSKTALQWPQWPVPGGTLSRQFLHCFTKLLYKRPLCPHIRESTALGAAQGCRLSSLCCGCTQPQAFCVSSIECC